MVDGANCPECDGDLVESSSERGDYFCPDCTRPVRSQDVVFYCSDCGDEPVSQPGHLCAPCRQERKEQRTQDEDGAAYIGEKDEDDLSSFAARDCPCCERMLLPFNLGIQPLHDGDENYYAGQTCPHCGEIIQRLRSPEGEEMADHAKEAATLDPNPPSDLSSMTVGPL